MSIKDPLGLRLDAVRAIFTTPSQAQARARDTRAPRPYPSRISSGLRLVSALVSRGHRRLARDARAPAPHAGTGASPVLMLSVVWSGPARTAAVVWSGPARTAAALLRDARSLDGHQHGCLSRPRQLGLHQHFCSPGVPQKRPLPPYRAAAAASRHGHTRRAPLAAAAEHLKSRMRPVTRASPESLSTGRSGRGSRRRGPTT